MDIERFRCALKTVLYSERSRESIGTYSEGTLHAVLKNCYESDFGRQELKVGKYIADIVGQDGIIEIQTRQLFKMKDKLRAFLTVSDVTVVYPVAVSRIIYWQNAETGEVSGKRKSPKHDNIFSAIEELYSLREFIDHPGFHFVALLISTEEYKYYKSNRFGKKINVRRIDRIPTDIIAEEIFYSRSDYSRIIPDGLPERFTSLDFSTCAGIPRSQAQSSLAFLYYIGLVRREGREKSGYIYAL